MTSARQIKTNHANARRSFGPKTAAGKARSAKNSLRHGLSSSVFACPVRSASRLVTAEPLIAKFMLRNHGPELRL